MLSFKRIIFPVPFHEVLVARKAFIKLHPLEVLCVIYIYIILYIYVYMRSVCIQSNMNVIRGLVKRAQLLWKLHNISDTCTTSLTRAQHLWHVHNISDTCTTSLKRAQHLWHVHNISDTCTTSLKRAHIEYLKTLGGGGGTRYTHIYI